MLRVSTVDQVGQMFRLQKVQYRLCLDSLEVQLDHNEASPSAVAAVRVLSHVVLSCRCVLKCSRRYRQCLYGEILSDFRLASKGLRKLLLSILLILFAFQTSAIKVESLRISPKPLLDRVFKKVWV